MFKYVFPAVLTPEDNGMYSVDFPDLESCYTCGDNLADALEMAEDVLGLILYDLEMDNKPIPLPSPSTSIKIHGNQFVNLVATDTVKYRKLNDKRAIKKTLTIPSWLNELAERSEVNFSAVLQKALKAELNIAE